MYTNMYVSAHAQMCRASGIFLCHSPPPATWCPALGQVGWSASSKEASLFAPIVQGSQVPIFMFRTWDSLESLNCQLMGDL